ncbi:SAM dependent carboxyl methyltransferase, partial [Dillenia turbinata]
KQGAYVAKTMMDNEIAEKLDIEQLFSSSKLFNIADLGCSIGPNTFTVVQSIIDAVEFKYRSSGLSSSNIEFQVYFNDQTTNDFNTLFRSLPLERRYFASGVPGTFYGRLFPKASLQFVHSSYGVHWLSKIPNQVVDENPGRIHYRTKEVEEAFASQFAADMKSFLQARAEEIVCGGLMALLVCGLPSTTNLSKCSIVVLYEIFGCCFLDMVKMGLIEEAKVDSFNIPIYYARKEELETLIQNNGCFDIERMEVLPRLMHEATTLEAKKFILMLRAACEVLICEHFGAQIIEELFQRFYEKIIESGMLWDSNYMPFVDIFLLLKRKVTK